MKLEQSLRVRVPGSSANIGPGFDVLGMAVTLHAELGIVDDRTQDTGSSVVEGRHPAHLAFREAGGKGDIWVRSPIPSGRGLGFSGAMRVGAVALGLAERAGVIGGELQPFIDDQRDVILNLAAELEGHADNVAASLFGGVVACAEVSGEFIAANVPLARGVTMGGHIVVWVPHEQTATSESRATLARSVTRADAVFNLARLAQLIVAFGSADPQGLAIGVGDRLHQDQRLDKVPMSRLALETMQRFGSTACWLSGSGPTVAAFVLADDLERVESALGHGELAVAGRVMRLAIDVEGLQAAR